MTCSGFGRGRVVIRLCVNDLAATAIAMPVEIIGADRGEAGE